MAVAVVVVMGLAQHEASLPSAAAADPQPFPDPSFPSRLVVVTHPHKSYIAVSPYPEIVSCFPSSLASETTLRYPLPPISRVLILMLYKKERMIFTYQCHWFPDSHVLLVFTSQALKMILDKAVLLKLACDGGTNKGDSRWDPILNWHTIQVDQAFKDV